MATQEHFVDLDSFKRLNSIPIRSTIETAFYGNNIRRIEDLKEAYELAKNSPGTIELTGMPVYKPVELGLPEGANVLLFNDGAVYGRCAAARRIIGEPNVNVTEMAALLREAVYNSRFRKYYRAEAIIGLDEDFMVKAHLMIPEGFENNLYSWMLNFQYINEEYAKRYEKSRPLANDGDIYVFADPYWTHPDYPLGLAFFSPEQNCAAILGMRYFGEYKKGTLTLGWGIAARNGYASCHGGLKRMCMESRHFRLTQRSGQRFIVLRRRTRYPDQDCLCSFRRLLLLNRSHVMGGGHLCLHTRTDIVSTHGHEPAHQFRAGRQGRHQFRMDQISF